MKKYISFIFLICLFLGCSNKNIKEYQGTYTYGHEMGIFQETVTKQDYWLYSENSLVEELNNNLIEIGRIRNEIYPEINIIVTGIDEGKATNGLAEENDRKMKVIKYKIIK